MKHQPCILAVDDDPAILKAVVQVLEHKGYIAKTAANGTEAIQAAEHNSIDLIILDVFMPGANGYAVCQQFKNDDRFRDIPVIFLSAIDDPVDKVKGLQVGGVDYIVKPFAIEELIARIETHLSLTDAKQRLELQNTQLQAEIARHQVTQSALSRNEALLAEAQQLAHVGNWDWDLQTDVVVWSDELYRIYGLDAQTYQPTPNGFLEFVHSDDRDLAQQVYEDRVQSQEMVDFSYRIHRSDGETRFLYSRGQLIVDDAGTPLRLFGISQDITERNRLQDALQASENRYRQIIENASDLVYTTDARGFFTYLNPMCERITGYPPETLLGERFTKVIADSWQERVYEFYSQQLHQCIPETRYTFLIVTPDGEEKWVEQSTILLRDGDHVEGFQCICRDITESRQMQEALHKSQKQLSKAQHIAHMGSFEWDIAADRVTVSDAMYSLFDLDPNKAGALMMSDILQWIHPDDVDLVVKTQQQSLVDKSAKPLEYRIVLQDKTVKHAYSEAEVVYNEQGEPTRIIGVVQDVTERKQLEAALSESEQRYRLLIENAIDVVYTTDVNGFFTYINDIGARMAGYEVGDIIGKHFTSLIPERYCKQVVQFYRKQFQDRVRETRLEFPVIIHTGDEHWIEQTTTLLMEGDYIKGFQSIGRDISDRKRIEAERERLIGELDAFAHTVAHDLKNPLAALSLKSQKLSMFFEKMPVEKRQSDLLSIQEMADKMAAIVDALLLLASIRNPDDIPIRPLDMAQVVAAAQQRLAEKIVDCNVQIIIPYRLPAALGYAPWIEEVWMNYIENALNYGGAPPAVEIGADEPQDGTIRYWVKDNGVGLLPEDQARLFTPFTRLNQTDATGHGLGLSIVQRIVSNLGGEVGVETNPQGGCCFYFTLPTSC